MVSARPRRDPGVSEIKPSPGPRPDNGLIRIGIVSGTHGLRGAVKVRTDDPDSTTLNSIPRVFIDAGAGPLEHKIQTVAALGAGRFRIVFEGVADIDSAQALKTAIVMAARDELPPRGPAEFYFFEVEGAEVLLPDGTVVGRIEEMFSTGGNDVWVVRGAGREVLIPVIADIVKVMDLAARRITIESVPGLLD